MALKRVFHHATGLLVGRWRQVLAAPASSPVEAPVLKTGFSQLDRALGVGGLPQGCLTEMSSGDGKGALSVAARIAAGNRQVFGMMVESHLVAGAQKFAAGKDDPSRLLHGVSITDACIGWEDSVKALETLAAAVSKRRSTSGATG